MKNKILYLNLESIENKAKLDIFQSNVLAYVYRNLRMPMILRVNTEIRQKLVDWDLFE